MPWLQDSVCASRWRQRGCSRWRQRYFLDLSLQLTSGCLVQPPYHRAFGQLAADIGFQCLGGSMSTS